MFLHVELQKTGTSFLQHTFFQSTEALGAHGLDMAPDNRLAAFRLMLRVRDRYDPAIDPPGVADALDRLRDRLAAAPAGRTLLTEESLAAAMKREIAVLLGACGDREVHVVLTVRDLARQIPSAWQEWVKRSINLPFEEYVEGLYAREVPTSHKFWAHQELPRTLGRWAVFVPPERIHVVTVPQHGADADLPLRRFCEVVDVDPAWLTVDLPRQNSSLGHVQAEVLRCVNAALSPGLRRRDVHGRVDKRYFAGRILRRQQGEPARLHVRHRAWCDGLARDFVADVRAGGYDVAGDLDELIPADRSYTDDDTPEAAAPEPGSGPATVRRRLARALRRQP